MSDHDTPDRCYVCGNRRAFCTCPGGAIGPALPIVNEGAKCSNCTHAAHIQNGYSNYTVEGCDLYCMVNEHPLAPFDEWFQADDRLSFAALCPYYAPGTGLVMDTEQEDVDEIALEHRAWWWAFTADALPAPPAAALPDPATEPLR